MSSTPEDRNAELRALFFETANELLQSLNEAGLELEARPSDEEIIRSVRRVVHTLKGDSAACGFTKLSEIAHELEDVLTQQMVKSHGAKAFCRRSFWSPPTPLKLCFPLTSATLNRLLSIHCAF